jgi:intergrase/recombinase
MLSKVKEMMRALPAPMVAVIRFAVLTGLRPSETCESVRLLNLQKNVRRPAVCKDTRTCLSTPWTGSYYNPEQQCLEHFRFPDIFLRQTKKAYISYITKEQLSGIELLGPKTPTWNAIRLACRYRNINMDMRLCRKVFASWLINKEGIDSTTVDMLQGRCPSTVLARHYQSPSTDLRDRVLAATSKLQKIIEE